MSALDVLILLVYLFAVAALSLKLAGRNRDASDYLLGNRTMPWWAVLGSIVATETSTVTFLAIPGLAWKVGGNIGYLQLALGLVVGRVAVARWLLPRYFQGHLLTAYQLLQRRFGRQTQRTASGIFLVTRNLGDGIRLYLTALVVDQLTGWGLPAGILLVGVSTILYTIPGGMKAVIWSDCLQLVIYLVGGITALLMIVGHLPHGWSELLNFAQATRRLQVVNWDVDFTQPWTLWAGLIGGALLTTGTHGTDQVMVQRYLCTASAREAGKALIASGVVVFLQFALFLAIGVGLAAFYDRQPAVEPLDQNTVFIHFILKQLPSGVVGLIIAAVFSAAMSTLSSSLNSAAGAVVGDFCADSRSPEQQLILTRRLTLAFGILQMLIAATVAFTQADRSLADRVLSVASFSSGLLVGVFALGTLSASCGQRGAAGGMAAGCVILCLVYFFTPIAWPWYTLIGAGSTFAAGQLISHVERRTSPSPPLQADPDASP